MQPEAITWFKKLCQVAALIDFFLMNARVLHKFHLVIAYDFSHFSLSRLLDLAEILFFDILEVAILAIPYALALLVCRFKSRLAKYAFYACVVFWFMETGGSLTVMTFGIQRHLHPVWPLVMWAVFASTQLLLLGLAIVVVNDRSARQWLHGYS